MDPDTIHSYGQKEELSCLGWERMLVMCTEIDASNEPPYCSPTSSLLQHFTYLATPHGNKSSHIHVFTKRRSRVPFTYHGLVCFLHFTSLLTYTGCMEGVCGMVELGSTAHTSTTSCPSPRITTKHSTAHTAST